MDPQPHVVKLLNSISSEEESSSSRANIPASGVLGIRPKEIAHGPLMWYLLLAVDCSNLIKSLNVG